MSDGKDGAKSIDKKAKMDNIEAKLYSDQKAQEAYDEAIKQCLQSDELIHLGLGLFINQYVISGRETSVALGVAPLKQMAKAKQFHELNPEAFVQNTVVATRPEPPSPKRLYPIGASPPATSHFEAFLTTVAPLIYEHGGHQTYKYNGNPNDEFNDYLGQAVAAHVSRTKTFRTVGAGVFKLSKVKFEPAAAPTEKFALKIHVYLKMFLRGETVIYEIVDGRLVRPPITVERYDALKVISYERYTDDECQSMPLIPGVHQVHALIEESGGAFRLVEVYIDADRVYPT